MKSHPPPHASTGSAGASRSKAGRARAIPSPAPSSQGPAWKRADLAVVLGLILAVAAIYGQDAGHAFVYLDDDVYVFANPHVLEGLSWQGVRWAFTAYHASNWHPLTWISHMLDVSWFGAAQEDAGRHHLVNVVMHAATAVVLFDAMRRATGARWRSALVAALFAVHPLRVESVAWVSERKDVLSGSCFALALWSYVRYARRPALAAYAWVLLWSGLGLLAKPMLVTLPFVLLLCDVWPLGRWSPTQDPRFRTAGRLVLEKLPLFAAAALVSLQTVRAQTSWGSVAELPPAWRAVTAALAYPMYLWKTLWPSGLAPLYVHPATLEGASLGALALPAVASLVLFAAITWVAFRLARRRPYAIVGWLWFLGMMVPVSGVMHVGNQLWADRYAYLPLIGVYAAVVWGTGDLVTARPRLRPLAAGLGGAIVVAYGVVAHAQAAHWRDSRTLFEHALAVTRNNWMISNNLGAYLMLTDPASNEARRHLEAAVRWNPRHVDARANLGSVLFEQGDPAGAGRQWEALLALSPEAFQAHLGLGQIASREGRFEQARLHLERAVRANPKSHDAHAQLAIVLASTGDLAGARSHLEEGLRLQPESPLVRHLLARWLATAPGRSASDLDRALELAAGASRATHDRRPDILATLAAVHAARGEFAEAVRRQGEALAAAPPGQHESYRALLERYRAGATPASRGARRGARP